MLISFFHTPHLNFYSVYLSAFIYIFKRGTLIVQENHINYKITKFQFTLSLITFKRLHH